MRLCGLVLLLLILLAAAPSTQVAAKRSSRPKKTRTRTRTSKKALAKAAREAEAREKAAFFEELQRDDSTRAVESWLRPALEAAWAATGGDLSRNASIVLNVSMTGGQILDDLKSLGWEGFTADADQQVGGQMVAAAAGVCDPNGVTQKGWHEDPRPQSPVNTPVECNGCVQDYYVSGSFASGIRHMGCGCYNGLCWSTCTATIYGVSWGYEWCYTNKPGGYSQDFKYKSCTKNSDCTYHDVQCASSCTV